MKEELANGRKCVFSKLLQMSRNPGLLLRTGGGRGFSIRGFTELYI